MEAAEPRSAENCQRPAIFPAMGMKYLETVAKKRGIPAERINQYEEKATGSLLYSLFVMSRVQSGDANMLPEEGKVFFR